MQNNETSGQSKKNLSNVIKIDQAQIHQHLDTMVRETFEQTINKMLDEEADRLCNAARYEHTDDRMYTRDGHYTYKLHVRAGVVNLKIPKLRKTIFETAIIERHRRREASVEEALIEMCWSIGSTRQGYYQDVMGQPYYKSWYGQRRGVKQDRACGRET